MIIVIIAEITFFMSSLNRGTPRVTTYLLIMGSKGKKDCDDHRSTRGRGSESASRLSWSATAAVAERMIQLESHTQQLEHCHDNYIYRGMRSQPHIDGKRDRQSRQKTKM